MAKKRPFRLSKSSIEQYLACPRSWFYERYPGIPRKVDYPRLCGLEVHRHIRLLHKPPKTPRPFYFQTLEAALSQWKRRWWQAVEEAQKDNRLILPKTSDDNAYCQIGISCITNYWHANYDLPRPQEVESVYYGTLNGVPLIGIFDQIRQVSPKWISRHRPEICPNGQLLPEFAPVVIVDLKTDYLDYDAAKLAKDPTLEDWIRVQYSLHENTQATLYTYLYRLKTDKMPVGFWWYHLRSGKLFFTFRDERSFATLASQVEHVMGNLLVRSFPKHVDRGCLRCDYLEPCNEDKCFLVTKPEELPGLEEMPEEEEPRYGKELSGQLKFRMKIPRPVKNLPEFNPKPRLILLDLPWDGPSNDNPPIVRY